MTRIGDQFDTGSAPVDALLSASPKAVVHLRAQLDRKRLGLIFGSGASRDLKFPDWNELVAKIAAHPHVRGESLLKKFQQTKNKDGKQQPTRKSLSSLTQILFGLFRSNAIRRKHLTELLTFLDEQEIRSDWLKIIHQALYQHIDANKRRQSIAKHKYIPAFLDIIKKTPMTVNYNFEDTLEKLLFFNRTPREAVSSRGYPQFE